MNALVSLRLKGAETFRTAILAPCGSIAELRAFIGETMALVTVHADLAETYATLGDDKGLEYALRCLAASSKAALETLADLKAANKRGPLMAGNDMEVVPVSAAEPLTSSDCDLRDFPFMPLDVRRLLTSATWIEAADDPKLGHALVCLWCESWQQVPAGSLPDNPRVLARLAMCTAEEWQRIADQALAGWQRCSDGRLYHPVVAEKVLEAWVEKLGQRKSSGAGNAKRWGVRFDASGLDKRIELATEMLTGLNPESRILRKRQQKAGNPNREPHGSPARIPSGSQETETETETGTKERKEDDAALSAGRRASQSREPYAFEVGVIRLHAKDLEAWRKDYPNLSLEAELRSLSEWAGRPENARGWFHAVQAGLAKRNRESALAVERVKAEAIARAHAPPARQPSAYVP